MKNDLFQITKPIIVIDGYDGCGKSTQIKKIQEDIDPRFCMVYEFPDRVGLTYNIIGDHLNGNLDMRFDNQADKIDFIAGMFSLNRLEYFASNYRPDCSYVFGRYTTSTILYQGTEMYQITKDMNMVDLFMESVLTYEHNCLNVPKEDLVIYLDIPKNVALNNISKRNEENSVYENTEFAELFIEMKEHAIEKYGWERIYCCDDNGNMYDPDDIYKMIVDVIKKYDMYFDVFPHVKEERFDVRDISNTEIHLKLISDINNVKYKYGEDLNYMFCGDYNVINKLFEDIVWDHDIEQYKYTGGDVFINFESVRVMGFNSKLTNFKSLGNDKLEFTYWARGDGEIPFSKRYTIKMED